VAQGLASEDESTIDQTYKARFTDAVDDDLNMPLALGVLHQMLQDKELSPSTKTATALDFDRVLGLDLGEIILVEIPAEITLLAQQREEARASKDWARSDELRAEIEDAGYLVKDTENGPLVEKK
jgi:cysteinyl-tRNA synthetase